MCDVKSENVACDSTPKTGAHLPLRRIANGLIKQGHYQQPASIKRGTSLPEAHDSCYSSCSEESHGSVSRESSDSLQKEFCGLNLTVNTACPHLEFATKLGYNQQQLQTVLDKLGPQAGQDQILSELVKLGRGVLMESSSKIAEHTASLLYNAPFLRSIIIDGSNIAMTHGRKEVFSCRGIRECVQFFQDRGHADILVFVPQFRRESARSDCPITDQHILFELEAEGILVWTPSRRIGGRRIVCHDDRYILKTADEKDAVIVSNDEYRDLIKENPNYRRLVENRLLMYSFVDGRFMPPDDPLGRHGPKLAQFLSGGTQAVTTQLCPYARKCTYGNKCKFYHPERPNGIHVSVTERLIKDKKQQQAFSGRPQPNNLNTVQHFGRSSISRTQSLEAPFAECIRPQLAACNLIGFGKHVSTDFTETQARCHEQWPPKQQGLQLNCPKLSTFRNVNPEFWHSTLDRHSSAPLSHLNLIVQPQICPPMSAPLLPTSTSRFVYDHTAMPPVYSGFYAFPSQPYPANDCNSQYPANADQKMYSRAVGQHCGGDAVNPNGFVGNKLKSYGSRGCESLSSSSSSSYLFAPSAAVWGESELTVGPLSRSSVCTAESGELDSVHTMQHDRGQLKNLLSQLFPESTVTAVMQANPTENDPRKMCAKIFELQKDFET